MPLLIAALGIAATLYVYLMRARGAARVTNELIDAAVDVRLAARRFRFQRKANLHPAESIDDPRIAVAAIAAAFMELDGAPDKQTQVTMTEELKREFRATRPEAEELMALGRWMVAQCGTPHATIARLSRKLFKLAGPAGLGPLLTVVQNTLVDQGQDLSERQREALHDVRRAMNIR